jgi:hypothetical protein
LGQLGDGLLDVVGVEELSEPGVDVGGDAVLAAAGVLGGIGSRHW